MTAARNRCADLKPRQPMRCVCKHPKPSHETAEEFDALFFDVPIVATDALICDRCTGVLRAWRPCKPDDNDTEDDQR